MNAATLVKRVDDQGRAYLSGTMNYALERGAIIVLRKITDGEYHLLALSGDGRKPNNTPSTLGSFVEFDRDILALPEPDLSEVEFVSAGERKGKRGRG